MISRYSNWLKKQALSSTTQPLSLGVDSNDENYLHDQGYEKLGWRHFRRQVQFALSGQKKHLSDQIDPSWKKGLWIYKGIPQIGDALMDLAPRSLLQQQGFCIDLYTDTHLAAMFNGDPWLERVYDDPQMISSQNYDFVIVPSHKGRSLRHKSRLVSNLAWVSMHGFYTGPEFHRGKFATQRIIDLLGYEATELEFAQHQQQKLAPLSSHPADCKDITKIALALGGVDKSRTYNNWLAVAEALIQSDKKIELTLLGSGNAVEVAQAFMSKFTDTRKVTNQVNKTDITECRRLIEQQDLFIAADGGLMHLGATTQTKLVSLFHAEVDPRWRISGTHLQSALQSATNSVSDITVDAIVRSSIEILADQCKAGLISM
ncbi:glycosyltransferase family 9 protein [Polaromonas sp.]|uniref:glycosyltransferase family 9 protein n=1 Tax=Polaromonas sp. TaxID=1869339 RepID=UPI003BB6CD96